MIRYGKLVRDRVPEVLRARGLGVTVRTVGGAELARALRAKLDEELGEYDSAADDESAIAELADLLEVLVALARQRGCDEAAFTEVRVRKAAERGAFELGQFLLSAG